MKIEIDKSLFNRHELGCIILFAETSSTLKIHTTLTQIQLVSNEPLDYLKLGHYLAINGFDDQLMAIEKIL